MSWVDLRLLSGLGVSPRSKASCPTFRPGPPMLPPGGRSSSTSPGTTAPGCTAPWTTAAPQNSRPQPETRHSSK